MLIIDCHGHYTTAPPGHQAFREAQLARLDDREERAELAELTARAEFLAAEVERYRQLVQRRVVSSQSYERAVSEYGPTGMLSMR